MKKFIRILILFLFTLAALFSILLVIKPGASIFHIKQRLSSTEIKPFDGHAFYIPLNLNSRVYPPDGILLFEGEQPLQKTFTAQVIETGLGSYSLSEQGNGLFNIVFSTTDNDDPTDNGKQYTLLFKPAILNRATGLFILLILFLTLAWFSIFVIKHPSGRKSLLAKPTSIIDLLDEFSGSEIPRAFKLISTTQPVPESRRKLWTLLLLLTISASFLYVLMEWVFFVTKPSFMDLMGWGEKTEILLVSSFGLLLPSLVLVLFFAVLDWLISKFRKTWLFILTASFVPTIILAAISLILVDNFTYTVFGFGVVSSTGIIRFIYALAFIIISIYINRWILRLLGLRGESNSTYEIPRLLSIILVCLLIISTVISVNVLINGFRNNNVQFTEILEDIPANTGKPNIILIGSDGLNATNMSMYGYDRETTPELKKISKTSLVAENVFSNASNSAGSIISMLTGKSPAQTRVLYPPNILEGENAVQHLPGILRDEGYTAVELGVPHYVDAFKTNLLDGFTVVNDREINDNQGIRFARKLGLGNISYFLSEISDRILERVLHILFIQKMVNPFTTVTETTDIKHDSEQLEQLISLIQESDDPLFVHVHLMGTHGPQFDPQEREFSVGQTQQEDWQLDFYDDSIRNFDRYIGVLLDALEETGEINNSILIVYSDHPMEFNVRWRMPLMFHFPEGQFAGRIKTNVQNLDIAPTILDFLNLDHPEWMVGQSLLKNDIVENQLIFSTGTTTVTRNQQRRWVIESAQVKPPFYQFSFFNIINCHKWYWFDLTTHTWDSGDVPGHTMPCSSGELLSMEEIKEGLADYLASNQFDVSTLPFP